MVLYDLEKEREVWPMKCKKIISKILICVMVLSLVACKANNNTASDDKTNSSTESNSQSTTKSSKTTKGTSSSNDKTTNNETTNNDTTNNDTTNVSVDSESDSNTSGQSVVEGVSDVVANVSTSTSTASTTSTTSTTSNSITQENAAVDNSVSATTTNGTFTISTSDGKYTSSGNIYTITSAGTYSISGKLEGQILVSAGEEDTVVIELNGVTIEYSKDSPIKALGADTVEISAKSGTENVITDNRSTKTSDDENQGEGAISAKCDLKIKGTGTLVVTGNYNNGIHTTKDLTIQKLSLKCTAYNNALKGKDSITIKSGTVVAISTNGDGLKTENTDANKNGEVRGDITILSGDVSIYAAGDGIQAAHNFNLECDSDGNTANVSIYTGSYSSYTASDAKTTSYKGIKVQNELNISAGNLTIKSYDDALHADYGTAFDAGGVGAGTINISGGNITTNVYSPTSTTASGRQGARGGFQNQQSVSGADAIHADYILNISGGVINIDSAYEGLEANIINISGGSSYVAAADDGVNACSGNTTPQVNVTGGYLDVTVAANGDTDGIDSNGTYTQTGGVVITRGPNSEMAAAIDADGSVSVKGGTIIILGYGRISASSSVKSYSLSLHSQGSHTVNIGGTSYTFNNSSSYGRTICYSSVSVTN